MPLLNAELDQFAASHADIGGYLLGLWGLPQELIEAVALHHDPSAHEGTDFSVLSAVHVANALVHASGDNPEDPASLRMSAKYDQRYLARLRCEDRLEVWEKIAQSMAACHS